MTFRPTTSQNPSGISPLDLRVLVLPDAPSEKVGSLFLPPSEVEKLKFATMKGTLVAIGENAWEEAKQRSPHFVRPVPGDRVMIAKYGGIEIEGTDKVQYRVMNDEDVIARLEE